jgi:hypothetical protein
MDPSAQPAAVPQLRDAARGQVMTAHRSLNLERERKNLRTGLILGAVALGFAVLFVLRVWHYG